MQPKTSILSLSLSLFFNPTITSTSSLEGVVIASLSEHERKETLLVSKFETHICLMLSVQRKDNPVKDLHSQVSRSPVAQCVRSYSGSSLHHFCLFGSRPLQNIEIQRKMKSLTCCSVPFFLLPDRKLLRHHRLHPDEDAGQLLAVHLQEDLRLPVAVLPQEGKPGGGGPALRLRGELHKPDGVDFFSSFQKRVGTNTRMIARLDI